MINANRIHVLGTCIIGFFVAHCSRRPSEEVAPSIAVDAKCVAASAESMVDQMVIYGRTAPPPGGELAIASQVPGLVTQLLVREGAVVTQGQVVARIDSASAEDSVRQSEALRAQARAVEANSALTRERVRALVSSGIASKQEQEDPKAHAEEAAAAAGAAAAGLDVARRQLSRTVVRSSFNGTISRLFRGVGALVDGTQATPIAQITAASGVEFLAEVSAVQLAKLKEGQAAEGVLAETSNGFHATLRMRAPALDPATGLGWVRFSLRDLPDHAPIGSFGRIVVEIATHKGVTVVPLTALRGAVSDGSEVVICKDGKAELRAVTTGIRDPNKIEILEGLAVGEQIATEHVLGLESGTPLRPRQQP
jgi:RND family efflux transporter MFP subunit